MIYKLTIMNVHIVPKKKCNTRDTTNFITRYLQIDVALTQHSVTLALKTIDLYVRLVN